MRLCLFNLTDLVATLFEMTGSGEGPRQLADSTDIRYRVCSGLFGGGGAIMEACPSAGGTKQCLRGARGQIGI